MSFTEQTLALHNGSFIPLYGLDTISYDASEIPSVVSKALNNGFRHIETAADYGVEEEIGTALLNSPVPRADLFITDEITGLKNTEATIRSAKASLKRLHTDYFDLLLMAWNGGEQEDSASNKQVMTAWKGLEQLYKNGSARAIGIVDFLPWQVEYLLQDVEIAPMVCHVGLYPGHPDIEQLATYTEHRILTMAYLPEHLEKVITSRELRILAEKHHCAPLDIVLEYLQRKKCAITLRNPEVPETRPSLSEEEMIFLDVMKDYSSES